MALLATNGYQALAMDLPGRHIFFLHRWGLNRAHGTLVSHRWDEKMNSLHILKCGNIWKLVCDHCVGYIPWVFSLSGLPCVLLVNIIYLVYLQILLLLGGYGKSPDSEALKTDQNRVDLLSRFMESLGVRAAVLLSPSMSGHYSIPFLMKNSDQLHGFIPIAPVGTRSYTPQQYQNIKVREVMVVVINIFKWEQPT